MLDAKFCKDSAFSYLGGQMPEPNDDTPIYRIYNFFDLINTLSTSSIRLSQVSRMEDPNELFGIYFDLLRSKFGPQSLDHVDQTQRKFREAQSHHYMTCWTRVPQNIAVWSLYSPGKDAIQVRTTYGKLRKALVEHFKEWHYAHAYRLQPNDRTNLFLPPEIGAVDYVDFNATYSSLRHKCSEYFDEREHWLDTQVDGTISLEKQVEGWPDADEQIRARVFCEPRLGGALLKDFRYQHEQEVRFVLKLTRRDGRTKEEYEAHPMAGLDGPWRSPRTEDCPPNVFVPFNSSNLGDFQVDGRIEDYKFEAISNALAKFDIKVTRNSAFHSIEV